MKLNNVVGLLVLDGLLMYDGKCCCVLPFDGVDLLESSDLTIPGTTNRVIRSANNLLI